MVKLSVYKRSGAALAEHYVHCFLHMRIPTYAQNAQAHGAHTRLRISRITVLTGVCVHVHKCTARVWCATLCMTQVNRRSPAPHWTQAQGLQVSATTALKPLELP